MVVSKLRSFTKGPAWLRDASCEIFSSILQSHRGVETVLSGYLEGAFVLAPAKMLMDVPQGFNSFSFLPFFSFFVT